MIASAGYYMMKEGLGLADLSLTAKPNIELGAIYETKVEEKWNF